MEVSDNDDSMIIANSGRLPTFKNYFTSNSKIKSKRYMTIETNRILNSEDQETANE